MIHHLNIRCVEGKSYLSSEPSYLVILFSFGPPNPDKNVAQRKECCKCIQKWIGKDQSLVVSLFFSLPSASSIYSEGTFLPWPELDEIQKEFTIFPKHTT